MPGAQTFCQATIGLNNNWPDDNWPNTRWMVKFETNKNKFFLFLPQSNSPGALTICQVTIGQMTIGLVIDVQVSSKLIEK